MEHLLPRLTANLSNILREAFQMQPTEQTLVIFDTESPLARLMTEGYRQALPAATFVDFASVTPEDVAARFDALKPRDLVVLIQTTNFRLNDFRLRIQLFKRALKTIEHGHLNRMSEEQIPLYIDALAYDPTYYRPLGQGLKQLIDHCQGATVECAGTTLRYDGPMEETKLNIGDYTGMENIGGSFPIGEVFTEPRDLTRVNGEAMIFAFAGEDHLIRTYEPFKVTVKDGILTADADAPAEFLSILDKIREDEDVLVREFGLGLNAAFDKHHVVSDITAFERQKGLHLSLGAKHGVYAKAGFNRKKTRYHVDVFVDAQRILLDDYVIYQQGEFHV